MRAVVVTNYEETFQMSICEAAKSSLRGISQIQVPVQIAYTNLLLVAAVLNY